MGKYGSYLVCHGNVSLVKKFLKQFFKEDKGRYNHNDWVTLIVPGGGFKVNLMKGKDQKLTQNMTFEIDADSMKNLQKYSKKFKKRINSFVATETKTHYRYHYIEIKGPKNICKIEISFIEHLG